MHSPAPSFWESQGPLTSYRRPRWCRTRRDRAQKLSENGSNIMNTYFVALSIVGAIGSYWACPLFVACPVWPPAWGALVCYVSCMSATPKITDV